MSLNIRKPVKVIHHTDRTKLKPCGLWYASELSARVDKIDYDKKQGDVAERLVARFNGDWNPSLATRYEYPWGLVYDEEAENEWGKVSP